VHEVYCLLGDVNQVLCILVYEGQNEYVHVDILIELSSR